MPIIAAAKAFVGATLLAALLNGNIVIDYAPDDGYCAITITITWR